MPIIPKLSELLDKRDQIYVTLSFLYLYFRLVIDTFFL